MKLIYPEHYRVLERDGSLACHLNGVLGIAQIDSISDRDEALVTLKIVLKTHGQGRVAVVEDVRIGEELTQEDHWAHHENEGVFAEVVGPADFLQEHLKWDFTFAESRHARLFKRHTLICTDQVIAI